MDERFDLQNPPRETVSCPLCGADDPSPLYTLEEAESKHGVWLDGHPYQIEAREYIVRCGRCRTAYVNPRIADLPGLAPYSPQAELEYFEATRPARLKAYLELLGQVPGWLGRPARSLLDIGCGDGVMLEAGGLAGIKERSGTEVSGALVELANQRLGAELVREVDLDELPERHFDVVALINVLEHVRRPKLMLAQISRRLKPGGLLLVHVPNLAGLPARVAGARWHQFEPYAHFTYFTPATLERMLGDTGFEVLASFALPTGGRLGASLQRALAALRLHLDNGLGLVARG